jgi:hypothetical protein
MIDRDQIQASSLAQVFRYPYNPSTPFPVVDESRLTQLVVEHLTKRNNTGLVANIEAMVWGEVAK